MSFKGQLPRPIFAKIAPHEYLVANLARKTADAAAAADPVAAVFGAGTRPSGRAPSEARPVHVHAGSLSQAHGSAAVRLGQTSVVCGVRAEILPVAHIPQYRPSAVATAPCPDTDTDRAVDADNRRQLRDYDLLVPNLELATGCAPEFLPGGPPSVLAQELSTRLCALLHASGLVDAEPLKIWYQPPAAAARDVDMDVDAEAAAEAKEAEEADDVDVGPELKAYWTLYIDLLFLSLDGNAFDAAWAAAVAALRDTRLPHAAWNPDRNTVVCKPAAPAAPAGQADGSGSRRAGAPLRLRGLPVATTAAVCVENKKKQRLAGSASAVARWILLDPDRLEEGQCCETATVVVDATAGRPAVVRAISKTGGVLLGPDELHTLVAAAETRWAEVAAALGSAAP